jgi:hypothetical protein
MSIISETTGLVFNIIFYLKTALQAKWLRIIEYSGYVEIINFKAGVHKSRVPNCHGH